MIAAARLSFFMVQELYCNGTGEGELGLFEGAGLFLGFIWKVSSLFSICCGFVWKKFVFARGVESPGRETRGDTPVLVIII